MKNSYQIVLAALAGGLLSSSALASKSDCSPSPFIHCAYVTGPTNSLSDGRYIKFKTSKGSAVVCMNGTSTNTILKAWGPQFLGKNQVSYSICNSSAGTKCQFLGTDQFVVVKSGNTYKASPVYYNINLDSVKSNFKPCKLNF